MKVIIKESSRRFKEYLSYCLSKGVPMVIQEIKDGKPVIEKEITLHVTKKDRFFRFNGVIVAGNFAKPLLH